MQRADALLKPKVKAGAEDANHSAVTGHAAFVNREQAPKGWLRREAPEKLWAVKKTITQTPADNCSKSNCKDKVAGLLRAER